MMDTRLILSRCGGAGSAVLCGVLESLPHTRVLGFFISLPSHAASLSILIQNAQMSTQLMCDLGL